MDNDIDASVPVTHEGDQRSDVVLRVDVGNHGVDLGCANVAQRLLSAGQPFGAAGREDHGVTAAGERSGRGQPDPARAADDQNDSTGHGFRTTLMQPSSLLRNIS